MLVRVEIINCWKYAVLHDPASSKLLYIAPLCYARALLHNRSFGEIWGLLLVLKVKLMLTIP